MSYTTPVIEDDIKNWVSLAGADFVVNGIRESAKRGAKMWQYVDTLLKDKYKNTVRCANTELYQIDSELGF